MKDRIKQFMEYKSISAGELSALLEVQRSNISHILNGRNKPGAVFIEKLLLVFPELNARWLLTGQGDMVDPGLHTTNIEKQKVLFKEETSPGIKEEQINPPPSDSEEEVEAFKETAPVKKKTEIDRMVLIFKDGTFTTYEQREKE